MVITYKNRCIRTGWDCATSNEKRDQYASWAADFEREIETQCDEMGIDPDFVEADIDHCGNLKKSPKAVARSLVRAAAKRLCMI